MSISLKVAIEGDVRKVFASILEPIAEAGTKAIDLVGRDIKSLARADIAAAGFSRRWQNALRVDRYPRKGVSANAALWIYHKIPYADIFETGGTIQGKPYLWIPTSNAPKRLGRSKFNIRNYQKEVGPLKFINPPGKPPLAIAAYGGRSTKKLSQAGLRRGGDKTVVLFVGVPSVNIRDRFHLREIFTAASQKLASYYAANLKDK